MSKRIVSVLLICSGLLLMIAAFALFSYNLWDDSRAGNEAANVLEQIERIKAEDKEDDAASDSEFIPDYILNPEMDMPAVEINGYWYIGTITIPALGRELPVMQTWSYPQMQIAPCRYSGSVYLNNMIICGHNYVTHFGRLRNLQVGDEVIFTDMADHVFHYTVKEMDTLAGTAVEEMESGEWDLTIFTCTLGGQTRVTVRCEVSQ